MKQFIYTPLPAAEPRYPRELILHIPSDATVADGVYGKISTVCHTAALRIAKDSARLFFAGNNIALKGY